MPQLLKVNCHASVNVNIKFQYDELRNQRFVYIDTSEKLKLLTRFAYLTVRNYRSFAQKRPHLFSNGEENVSIFLVFFSSYKQTLQAHPRSNSSLWHHSIIPSPSVSSIFLFPVLGVAATPYQNLQLAKLPEVGGESLFPAFLVSAHL